jgi:hypothetical protein
MSHPSSALAAIVLGGEPPRNRVRPPVPTKNSIWTGIRAAARIVIKLMG